MIKAVIFDFFGVLVTEGFKQFREQYFLGDEQKNKAAIDLVNLVDSSNISGHEFTAELAKLAGIGPTKVRELLGNNKPNEPLLNYIRTQLKPNYKISILSNSSENYPSQILSPEDVSMFDDILLSYKYGLLKPQQEIYELAAERLGLNTTECIFTDDSESHCKGAHWSGMQAIYYQTFDQFKTDIEKLLQPKSA